MKLGISSTGYLPHVDFDNLSQVAILWILGFGNFLHVWLGLAFQEVITLRIISIGNGRGDEEGHIRIYIAFTPGNNSLVTASHMLNIPCLMPPDIYIYLKFPDIIKIHVRRAVGRGYSYFHLYMCVCFYLFVHLFMCVTPPGQTKNYTDLKFGTDTLLDHI